MSFYAKRKHVKPRIRFKYVKLVIAEFVYIEEQI